MSRSKRTKWRLEQVGEVGRLILADPPRNELTFAAFDELAELMERELPRLPVRGLVVVGAGRHFSSGSDLAELLDRVGEAGNGGSPWWCEVHGRTLLGLGSLPFPTVAAVRGLCLGSGLELALCCSARVVSRTALMALPETQHGLMPGCGGTVRLTELVGPWRAMEIVLRGEPVDPEEALEIGMVDRVVPAREVIAEAERLACCMGQAEPGKEVLVRSCGSC